MPRYTATQGQVRWLNRLIKNYGRSTMARNAHKSILDGRTNQPTKQVIESRTRDRKVSTQSHRCKFLYIIFFSNFKKSPKVILKKAPKPQKPRLKYNDVGRGSHMGSRELCWGEQGQRRSYCIVLYCINLPLNTCLQTRKIVRKLGLWLLKIKLRSSPITFRRIYAKKYRKTNLLQQIIVIKQQEVLTLSRPDENRRMNHHFATWISSSVSTKEHRGSVGAEGEKLGYTHYTNCAWPAWS